MTARTLSEAESKRLLARAGVVFATEHVVTTPGEATAAAAALGTPVVVKLNGDRIAHKTDRGLLRLNITTPEEAGRAASELLAKATADDGAVTIIVAEMIRGNREFIAGLLADEQFGPTVMLGIGGVLAEAVPDVVFRLVPVSVLDAHEMISELASQRLLGPFRGEPAVNRDELARVITALSSLAESDSSVRAADINPLIIVDGAVIAVDALVELAP